jgi:hypothetical protein
LHLLLEDTNHLLCLPIEVLASIGHKVSFYALFPCPLENFFKVPCLQLLGNSHQLLSLSKWTQEGLPWKHMNFHGAMRKLLVELVLEKSSFTAELELYMNMT